MTPDVSEPEDSSSLADLLTRWVRASYAIGKLGEDPFGGYIAFEIQSLGRLDVRLRDQDPRIASLVEDPPSEVTFELNDYLDLSRLWVLSSYELVRTLSACIPAGLWTPDREIGALLTAIKQDFTRLRIPLAKFEPAFEQGKARPGDLIARAVFLPGQGAGWTIEQTQSPPAIARSQLANQLLEFLEDVRAKNPHLPGG
jgi:hypothetical protein